MHTMAMSSSSPPTVAVIGAGPGGLFFCHALETYRQELEKKGDTDKLAKLPSATCFERAAGPGGVWQKKSDSEDRTNMYEALWMNGPKEAIEMYDYTFHDHFGDQSLPVYMPRALILEYMIARCTHNCPDFFARYCQFNTTVVHVTFLDNEKKFQVVTRNDLTGESTAALYDKCIWAGGENGRPNMPAPIVQAFREGGFTGRVIHSSETADFERDCKDKRILLIGGNLSAEDLALMAIKVGAERIFISTRQDEEDEGDAAVLWTTAWPYDKVEILTQQVPVRVTENGTCIQLEEVEWTFPDKYKRSGKIVTELRDIDTVIFCTGYRPNVGMLDKPLQKAIERDPNLQLEVPEDWKMTNNPMTKFIGDVVPNDVRWWNSPVEFPMMYRGMAIDNPNMMFIKSDQLDNPLCGVDVVAWYLMKVCAGEVEIPSRAEMLTRNTADAIHDMQSVDVRHSMDKAYYDAFEKALQEASPKARKAMRKSERKAMEADEDAYVDVEIYFCFLARLMKESNHPVDFGTFEELSDHAKTIIHYNGLSYSHREDLEEYEEEEPWRTFRDYDNGDEFKSLFTGSASISLKKHWLDLDDADENILLDV